MVLEMVVDVMYLVSQIALLQAGISTDALVDGPGKLIVELPGLKSKQESSESHQAGEGDQHGLDVEPKFRGKESAVVEIVGCVLDLVELDTGVDENADVV